MSAEPSLVGRAIQRALEDEKLAPADALADLERLAHEAATSSARCTNAP